MKGAFHSHKGRHAEDGRFFYQPGGFLNDSVPVLVLAAALAGCAANSVCYRDVDVFGGCHRCSAGFHGYANTLGHFVLQQPNFCSICGWFWIIPHRAVLVGQGTREGTGLSIYARGGSYGMMTHPFLCKENLSLVIS